jgi:hypothetical protein
MPHGAAVAGWLALHMLAAPATAARDDGAGARLNVRIQGKQAVSVRSTLQAALAQLERPQCAAVLDDFRDSGGKTLREGLESRGLTMVQHASRIFFYDASHSDMCRLAAPVAYTKPSSHVVLVCTRRFVALGLLDSRWAEATLIHEILHTLGLGENPPSSREITQQVAARCREG